MKRLFCVVSFFLVSCYSFGQQASMGVRSYNNFGIAPRGVITSYSSVPEEKSSSIYLDEDWRIGNIFLKDSTMFTDLNIKIDLKEKVLDIQYNGSVKALPFSQLLAVYFPRGKNGEEIYVNGGTLVKDNFAFRDQLFQALHEGEVSLYSKIRHRL